MGGTLKGLETVGGARIIDRVVSALGVVTSDIVLSANDPSAAKWLSNVAIMSDKQPGTGGISGVHAALSLGRDVIVVAWDMPFVSGDLLGAIAAAGLEHRADAAIPESDSPHRMEPFCAWYAASAFEPIDRFLADGGGSARDLVARLPRVHRIPMSETSRFGDPRVLFLSVNTPADLHRARDIADSPR